MHVIEVIVQVAPRGCVMSQRIPARPPEEWDDAVHEALSVLVPPAAATANRPVEQEPPSGSRPVSNMTGTFAWHPALARAYFLFNNHLFHSTLSDRLRELITVRTGWVRRAEYEWAQHVRMARAVGVTNEELDGVMEGPDSEVWSPFESAALRAVDEICADRYVSDSTWEQLSAELDRQQLMDLVFTVGAYDLLGMATNTFGLAMDPGLERFPDAG